MKRKEILRRIRKIGKPKQPKSAEERINIHTTPRGIHVYGINEEQGLSANVFLTDVHTYEEKHYNYILKQAKNQEIKIYGVLYLREMNTFEIKLEIDCEQYIKTGKS